jgi:hypothetical protein
MTARKSDSIDRCGISMYRLQVENCPFCAKKELFERDREMLSDIAQRIALGFLC